MSSSSEWLWCDGEIESKKLLYLKWMEEYMQSIRGGDGFVSQDSKMIYEDLEESLRELTTLTEKYYTPDEEGEYPVVKEEDYDKLIKGYQNVSRKISNYRKVAEAAIKNPSEGSNTQEYLGNKQMEEARLLTFSMLEPLIALDVDTLITSKTQGALDMPLGEMLAEGRVREVEYTGDVKTVGSSMSSRLSVTVENSKEFLRNRSVLRQTMRLQWDEKRRSVYQSLDTDSRKSLDKNIDYSIVAMSENAANRLAEMNTAGKKSAESLAEKVRHFATLAVELLWENEYYSGQKDLIRNTIPDKKTLMTQINQLAANKQFAEKQVESPKVEAPAVGGP